MSSERYKNIIDELKEKGLYNNITTIGSGQGAWLEVDGKNVLNFCSNNYLGLASDERLKKAACTAVKKYGVGTGSVRPLSGNNVLHMELEGLLANFKKAESALLLQSGFMSNIAAIQTILDKQDIVVSDEFNHASIIDAIKVSQVSNKFIFKHRDMSNLEEQLKKADELRKIPKNNESERTIPIITDGIHDHLPLQPPELAPLLHGKDDKNERTILIVTDGVFSMDGDLAPLPEIVRLAKKYGAMTMVDDAHGEGVLGEYGRGIVDHFKLHGQVDIEVGTLSKAFGVIGGFITGKKELIEYYRQKARPLLFSNGLSIPDTAALIESVRILSQSDDLVKKLWKNADYLKAGFARLGLDTGKSKTPITPVMLGDENLAKNFSFELFNREVYATTIKYPMVPIGKARIRVMPSAIHTKKDLDFGLSKFAEVGKELGIL